MKLPTKAALLCAALLTASSGSATAGVVFFDDFSQENGGMTQLGDANLTNFYVNHDSPNLIGSDDPQGLTGVYPFLALGTAIDVFSRATFSFQAGDLVVLSLTAGGNQTGPSPDPSGLHGSFGAGFIFDHPTVVYDVASGGGFPFQGGPFSVSSDFNANAVPASDSPWQTYNVSFLAGEAGSVRIGIYSGFTPGALVDDVQLSIGPPPVTSPAPEPATWAMMIAGFGLAGSVLRRRATTAA
jgi:hypothetical protein